MEEKVRERTAQLKATVISLEKEIADRKKAQIRIHELSHKSIEAMEAERQSISRELHDSIGSSLAAVKLSFEELFEKSSDWSGKKADSLSGFGILNMQDRAQICGGSFSLNSRPGTGTRIRVSLPINEESNKEPELANLDLEKTDSQTKPQRCKSRRASESRRLRVKS